MDREHKKRDRASGPVAILVAALLWSTAGLLIKYIPWHPLAIASGRSVLTATVLFLYFRRRLWVKVNAMTLLSAVSLMLTQCLFVVANKLTTAANAIMLQYTTPLFILLISGIFFKVRPRQKEVWIMFAAVGGIALFFFDDLSPGYLIGNALALFTGLTFAGVFVFNNRPECHAPTALFLAQIGTFLVGLPFLIAVDPAQVRLYPVLALVLLGIFQQGVGYILFQFGIRRTQPLNASLLSMLEPIMNPVWVFLILAERPGPLALLGAIIVLAAMTGMNVRWAKKPVRQEAL